MIQRKTHSDEEKQRLAQATQRLTIRKLGDQYEVEIETESELHPISGRDFDRIIRSIKVAQKRHIGEYRLTLRRAERAKARTTHA
jgi:hypothetical protein